jgi:hypothetical protein
MGEKLLKIYKNLCRMDQRETRHFMSAFLRRSGYRVTETADYLYAEGESPVALVSHSDTVFKTVPKDFFYDPDKNVIWSPQGMGADDKAGILMMVCLIKKFKLRPHIIITSDEEIGCVGATKLVKREPKCPFKDCRYLIQLDRRGQNDSVYYDMDDVLFEDYINGFGFHTEWGSFTDISVIAPAWKIGAVNLSVGYENEHTNYEHLYLNWWNETLEKVAKMIEDAPNAKHYPFVEYIYGTKWTRYYGGKKGAYGYYYGWDDSTCEVCGDECPNTDLLPIYTPKQPRFGLDTCPTCFSKICLDMTWCSKCNKGWYGYGNIPGNNWVCPICEGKTPEQIMAESEGPKDDAGDKKDTKFSSRTPHHTVLF